MQFCQACIPTKPVTYASARSYQVASTYARAGRQVLLDVYRTGRSAQDMELALTVASLESGATLMGPLEQDMLLSWIALVLQTLATLGAPLYPGVRPPMAANHSMASKQGLHMLARDVMCALLLPGLHPEPGTICR